ncbi:hypothetical protein CJJ23_04925 [Mycoplasmopsis agassizii]|uniref:Transposase n=1 Tax=Mycoplasmopsis agassizii TaxID=33922 RepID=A0A269THC0_9BACT|nr:hypothetical protein [Mycoplasmopsis agassizii]PAK20873.1 hypothetical protein CJJ23_04925 [Mycoplasmopsis agassizii]
MKEYLLFRSKLIIVLKLLQGENTKTICNNESLLKECINAYGENRNYFIPRITATWQKFLKHGLVYLVDFWPDKYHPVTYFHLNQKSRKEVQKERRRNALKDMFDKMTDEQKKEHFEHLIEIIESYEEDESKNKKFERIKKLKDNNLSLKIKFLCSFLNVSETGYYKYLRNKKAPKKHDNREHKQKDQILKDIVKIFDSNYKVFGIDRITEAIT